MFENCIYHYQENIGFGDIWALTSYLLQISEELRQPARFSAVSLNLLNTIRLITPFMKTKGEIKIVSESFQRFIDYCDPFRIKLLPTYKTWSNNNSKIIAYQFDGKHLHDKKNLPLRRFRFLLNSLIEMGYEPVDVGHYRPISFIIDILSKCRFFVGCPSGLSVVCMSVDTPIHLITRQINPYYLSFMRNCQYRTVDVQMYTTVNAFLGYVKRQNYSCTNQNNVFQT